MSDEQVEGDYVVVDGIKIPLESLKKLGDAGLLTAPAPSVGAAAPALTREAPAGLRRTPRSGRQKLPQLRRISAESAAGVQKFSAEAIRKKQQQLPDYVQIGTPEATVKINDRLQKMKHGISCDFCGNKILPDAEYLYDDTSGVCYCSNECAGVAEE